MIPFTWVGEKALLYQFKHILNLVEADMSDCKCCDRPSCRWLACYVCDFKMLVF